MIDADLLRQLGWSEELISEVTRVAVKINGMVEEQKGIEEPIFRTGSESGNTIFLETPEINTSECITLSTLGKL
jgi:hypothetical protein